MSRLWLVAVLGQIGCAEWVFHGRVEDCDGIQQIELSGASVLAYELNRTTFRYDCALELDFFPSSYEEYSADRRVEREGDTLIAEGYLEPELWAKSDLPALAYMDDASPVLLTLEDWDDENQDGEFKGVVSLDYLPGARLMVEAASVNSSIAFDTAQVLVDGNQHSVLTVLSDFTELEFQSSDAVLMTVHVADAAIDFERLALTSTTGAIELWLPEGEYDFEIIGAPVTYPAGIEHSPQSARRVTLDASTQVGLSMSDPSVR